MTHTLKRTKIVCTLGPAVDTDDMVRQLLSEGMDVARLNFSHGSHAEHAARIERVKRLRETHESPCALMLDTKGPEIRTGLLPGGTPLQVRAGDVIELVSTNAKTANGTCTLNDGALRNLSQAGEGKASEDARQEARDGRKPAALQANDANRKPATPQATSASNKARAWVVPQTYDALADYVSPGQRILIDDGLIELEVVNTAKNTVFCSALNDGSLGQRKSINVPGAHIPLPALTEQDEADLLFGIEHGVDFVAASFVRDVCDVRAIRGFLDAHGGSHIGIVAKIECAAAVRNAQSIIDEADGIMVARGDLGVEVAAQEVPHIQKELIGACNRARKPVITATQMLDSMMRNPRPTRAEVADVANAIYDGTDCVMLSGETAAGAHPVEATRTMAAIAHSTETRLFAGGLEDRPPVDTKLVSLAVGTAAVQTAESIGANCIVCPTMTGRTARLVSSFRTPIPIYAITPSPEVMRSLQLHWGVIPMLGNVQGDMRHVIAHAQSIVLERGLVRVGDVAVFTSGDPRTAPVYEHDPSRYAPTNVMCVAQIR